MNVEGDDTGGDREGLVNVPIVGLSVVMFSSSSSVGFPDCSLEVEGSGSVVDFVVLSNVALDVEGSGDIEEVEVSTGSVVDFLVFSNGASVNGTERKNSNDCGDEDNDVTGDLEADTTSSSSETFSLGSQEKFPVPLVV